MAGFGRTNDPTVRLARDNGRREFAPAKVDIACTGAAPRRIDRERWARRPRRGTAAATECMSSDGFDAALCAGSRRRMIAGSPSATDDGGDPRQLRDPAAP